MAKTDANAVGEGAVEFAENTKVKTTKKKSGKVPLAPGHSPLDWARLCNSGANLKGVPGFLRVTVSELAKVGLVQIFSLFSALYRPNCF